MPFLQLFGRTIVRAAVCTLARSTIRCAALLIIAMSGAGSAFSDTADEYDIKAAFVLNFADYVEWPASTGLSQATPIRVCIVGDDPFGARIDQLLEARPSTKRQLIVHRMETASAALDCHIAFLGRSNADAIRRDLRLLSEKHILTVGEQRRFAEAGGVISLQMQAGRVRLIVNLSAARRQNLNISSRLLALAEVIE